MAKDITSDQMAQCDRIHTSDPPVPALLREVDTDLVHRLHYSPAESGESQEG